MEEIKAEDEHASTAAVTTVVYMFYDGCEVEERQLLGCGSGLRVQLKDFDKNHVFGSIKIYY